MNFDDVNSIYKHMRGNIYPNVQTLWKNVSTEQILMDKYLEGVGSVFSYSMLVVPFLIDAPRFLKDHKEKCIIFYNTPEPGAGLMLCIHQISPTLHMHSRYFCWIENTIIHDYMESLVFYKDHNDAIKFIDESFAYAKTGNTEETIKKGFQFQ